MTREEVCFPRGAPKSKRKQEEVETKTQRKLTKKRKVVERVEAGDSIEYDENMLDQLVEMEETSSPSNRIPYLTLKTVTKGMVLLGIVTEVEVNELKVSLPFLLKGYVSISRVCKAYHQLCSDEAPSTKVATLPELFEVGQLIVCSVLGVDDSNVELSLDPELVNKNCTDLSAGMLINGYVRSVEDHGYIVDVGTQNNHAFIPNNSDRSLKLRRFQFVRCVITEVKCDGRVLMLSCQQKLLNKAVQKELNFYYPGTLVKFVPELCLSGLVENDIPYAVKHPPSSVSDAREGTDTAPMSTSEGKFGKVCLMDACVSMIHLSNNLQQETNEEPQPKKQKSSSELLLKDFLISKPSRGLVEDKGGSKIACVLYTSGDDLLVLTANSCAWKTNQRTTLQTHYKEKFPIGQRYTSKVIEKIKNLGYVCQLHKSGVIGLVENRNIPDDRVENKSSVEKLKVRVVENNSLDGVIELTSKKNAYNAAYMSYNDVRSGEIVQAKILEVTTSNGLKVTMGSWQDKKFLDCNVRAIISSFHLSDISLKRPEKMFHEGDVLTCRVLRVNTKSKSVFLTHKKTLVQSPLPIITDYEQVNVDDVVHVYIKAIKHQGCIVSMYNNVKGFVPREELALPSDDASINEEYQLGQVVRARVCACDPKEQKLIMSFNLKKRR